MAINLKFSNLSFDLGSRINYFLWSGAELKTINVATRPERSYVPTGQSLCYIPQGVCQQ